MDWQTLISSKRLGKEDKPKPLEERRTEFQRDYDRLIFRPPFDVCKTKHRCFRYLVVYLYTTASHTA